MRKTSDKGILEIMEHEGVVPAPYLDSVGVWTFGVGHTHRAGGLDPRKMKRGMPADIDEALKLAFQTFRQDLEKFEARVNDAVKVPVLQHEFDALVSFDLNTGGIYRAHLTASLNRGDRESAARQFMGWLKPPEIRKRRSLESRLFRTGNYDYNGDDIAIWNVDTRGRLRGVREVLSGQEMLRRMRTDKCSNVVPLRRPLLDWWQERAA